MADSPTEIANQRLSKTSSGSESYMTTIAASTALPSAKVNAEAAGLNEPLSPRKRRRSSKPSASANRETRTIATTLPSRKPLLPGYNSQTLIGRPPKKPATPEYSPLALTGRAAIVDEQRARDEQAQIQSRHTSPNPARRVISNLLTAQTDQMSSVQDAPGASNTHAMTLSEPLAEVAPSIKIAPGTLDDGKLQRSPQSLSATDTFDAGMSANITANGASVSSPGQMDEGAVEDDRSSRPNSQDQSREDEAYADDGRSNKAFTYPGPLMASQAQRTSSLPQSGYGGRDSTRSPSSKRHKCPYCNTDFTRHHNLKSHLLTHSQEKPYSCDACDSRFRRLHDLKRHTKLHTGERPHVCPKCDRSFARGDALARHNKGQGGCAGRRSSMGSFGGDDRHEERMRVGDGDSMPGIMYTGETSHEPENMDEDTESIGGKSLPSIRKHDAPPASDTHHRQGSDQTNAYQSRQPSTYPPVAARSPNSGGLYPPPPLASPRGGSGSSTAQSSLNQHPQGLGAPSAFQAPGSNVFSQGGMTESPKPLSPGGSNSHQLGQANTGMHRNRSPSLTQQFQQQHFGRRNTGNTTSPSMNLPPPHPITNNSNAPQLPPLQGLSNLNPPDPRFTLHSQASSNPHLQSSAPGSLAGPSHGPHSPSYPPANASSANNSLSSHSTGPHTSLDRTHNTYAQPSDRLWAYVQSLESKIDRLEGEVISLKSQLNPPQHR